MSISRADDFDEWYHWLLKATEPQVGDSGLQKYFEDKFGRPKEERPWSLELSGRLRSQSPNLRDDVARRCDELNERTRKQSYAYRGRWLAQVDVLRTISGLDVFHEPTDLDEAHANLVADGTAVDTKGKILSRVVQDLLGALRFETP